MFEFVRTHTRLLQFMLLILILPSFVVFGIQGYSKFTHGDSLGRGHADGARRGPGQSTVLQNVLRTMLR